MGRVQPPGGAQALALAGLATGSAGCGWARGLDQVDLAGQAELDLEHLVSVERGEATPSLDVPARLATAPDVGLSELFTDDKPGPAVMVLRGNEAPTVDTDGMALQVLTPRLLGAPEPGASRADSVACGWPVAGEPGVPLGACEQPAVTSAVSASAANGRTVNRRVRPHVVLCMLRAMRRRVLGLSRVDHSSGRTSEAISSTVVSLPAYGSSVRGQCVMTSVKPSSAARPTTSRK